MTAPGRMNISQLRDLKRGKTTPKVRWYLGYSGRGKADTLVEELSRYLNQHRLTDTVCGMRVERRPRGEFYFFLTLETDYFGLLPDELGEALESCPRLQFKAGGPYELRDIQTMVSSELKIKALGQCLAYRRMRQDTSEDPFRADVVADKAETDSALGGRAERLLWYLSSLGGGRWSAFSVACTALGVGDLARRLARSLRLLGHLEVSSDGERWSVTPPTCLRVRQPDGTALRFWAGARTAATTGERSLQQGGPSRLLAGETAGEELVNPAERLAPLLPTLEEYRASLGVVGGVSAVQHKFARFDGLAFKPLAFEGEPGLYEVTGREGRTLTLLYSQGQWLKGDWYGLRYLTLQASGLLLSARYDAERWSLALPADQRPPELFERALVLCSGLLPSRRERWLTYQNVPPGVAQEVAERLNIVLEPHDLPDSGEAEDE